MQNRIKMGCLFKSRLPTAFIAPVPMPTSSHLLSQLNVVIFKLVNKLYYLFICKLSLSRTSLLLLFSNIS